MKKRNALALLLALGMLLALCGCGSGSGDYAAMEESYVEWVEPAEAEWDYYYDDYNEGLDDGSYSSTAADSTGTEQLSSGTDSANLAAEKIIYTTYADLEVLDLDAAVAELESRIAACGGFIENSTVNGSNYYGRGTRSASYTIRIPRESFLSVTDSLTELGTVPYCSTSAENVTSAYTDTESRLASYRTQEERLLAMLAECETVSDMLEIESRLADVRYYIESLTSSLQNWDSRISYSTLNLEITEVTEYTPEPEPTYWQTLGRSFVSSLKALVSFLCWLVKAILVIIPFAVVFGGIAWIVVRLVRARAVRKGKPVGREARKARRAARRAAKAAAGVYRPASVTAPSAPEAEEKSSPDETT